jgi:hypothetical protein
MATTRMRGKTNPEKFFITAPTLGLKETLAACQVRQAAKKIAHLTEERF